MEGVKICNNLVQNDTFYESEVICNSSATTSKAPFGMLVRKNRNRKNTGFDMACILNPIGKRNIGLKKKVIWNTGT